MGRQSIWLKTVTKFQQKHVKENCKCRVWGSHGGSYECWHTAPFVRMWSAGFFLSWFYTLKMEVIRSSETFVYIRTIRRYIREDGNFQELEMFHFYSSVSVLGLWELLLAVGLAVNKNWKENWLIAPDTLVVGMSTIVSGLMTIHNNYPRTTTSHRLIRWGSVTTWQIPRWHVSHYSGYAHFTVSLFWLRNRLAPLIKFLCSIQPAMQRLKSCTD
jgi:hypothetical protein